MVTTLYTSTKLEESSTHKSAKTHAYNVFVTHDLELLTPYGVLCWLNGVGRQMCFLPPVLYGNGHTWGQVPLSCFSSSLVYSLPYLLLCFTFSLFPFLVRFVYSLLSSIPSFSTRIVTTRFPGQRS